MIEPCGYRLVVKPFKLKDVDDAYAKAEKAGIYIVRENEKREDQSVDKGVVLAIGPNCWTDSDKPWCHVGDTILFAKFSPKFVTDPETSEEVGILNDEDVVAVIKENNK